MIVTKDKSGKISFRLTKEDFIFSYYSGSGAGGQARNKHQNCVRLKHEESGATGTGQTERDRLQNEKTAFQSLTNSPKFKFWCDQKLKELEDGATLEEKIDKELVSNNLKFEVKDENDKWIEVSEKELKNES